MRMRIDSGGHSVDIDLGEHTDTTPDELASLAEKIWERTRPAEAYGRAYGFGAERSGFQQWGRISRGHQLDVTAHTSGGAVAGHPGGTQH